ncbi:MAG: penicillin acylase family protein [Proteobacteria bacterium]|nr:penicillin acylase family protein [Pseudomonadota bacterium]
MKRIIRRLILFVVIVIAGCSLALFLILNASLPQLDGEISASRISADIRIQRDAGGMPTVSAKNRADLAFGTGFVHGQDRFFQMDLTRRQAAGELAEIIGPAALEIDKRNRLHRFRSRASRVITRMASAKAEILSAYVAGVNAGLDSLGARPFEYFILGVTPEPWRPEDTLLVAYAMFLELNDERASHDIKRGLVHRVMPVEAYDWLYPSGTKWDAPIVGEARKGIAIPSPEQLNVRDSTQASNRSNVSEDAEAPLLGSNNWAVSGKLSQSGRAIVANDMHLKLGTPNVFYRARLVMNGADERDVSGVTLPGTPAVVAGSNGHVAWGFTNSYGDWSDAVILRPGRQPDSYLTPGGEMKFAVYKEQIDVKGESPREFVVRETIWGPVLDDHSYPDVELAVRWLAHEPNSVNLRQLDLETVKSVFEAVQVANGLGIPPQNFVSGDAEGNIAWTIAGQLPVRTEYDSSIPADWSEGGGWIGWLDADDYPRVVNPEGGIIWTANARVVDGDVLRKIGDGDYDLGARAMQIRDDLFAKESFKPADMLAIQFDDRAILMAPWRELLLTVLDDGALRNNAQRREYRELVDHWIPRASPESVGYRLVRAFRSELRKTVFDALMRPVTAAYDSEVEFWISKQFEGPLWAVLEEQPLHLLPAEYDSWQDLMLQAVDRNLEYFANNFEGGLAQRNWGERNMATIRHPLSQALPILSRWLDMPREPLSGDSNLPKAQGPGWGASERFAVSPGNEANGYLHMPTGQSGHPLSEFYRAGHENWVHGRPVDFLPGATQHVLTLTAQE